MEFKTGDIFLIDSDKTGAKIVKFLMTAPTIWQYLWRKFRGTQEPVRYYHAGMVLDKYTVIEQEWKVETDTVSKLVNAKRIIIYRYKNLTEEQTKLLHDRAVEDLGKTYDIPQLIGKTLTWLTGIKWFVRFLGGLSKEEEICITRDGDWFWIFCHFGVKTKHELTTKIVDEYCQNHPEEWEIVYDNQGTL
jgi:hypothetical protein